MDDYAYEEYEELIQKTLREKIIFESNKSKQGSDVDKENRETSDELNSINSEESGPEEVDELQLNSSLSGEEEQYKDELEDFMKDSEETSQDESTPAKSMVKKSVAGALKTSRSQKIAKFNWLTNDELDDFGERVGNNSSVFLYLGSHMYQFFYFKNYARAYNHLKRVNATKYECLFLMLNIQHCNVGCLHWLLGCIFYL